MENNTNKKNEYSIQGKFPLEPKFNATYNLVINNVSFFEVSPDNSTVIVWSQGLYCLDSNITIIDFTEWGGGGSIDSIAFNPSQKKIAGSFKGDIFVFDLLNDSHSSNMDRNKISDYDDNSDKIICLKFIDDNILLTGDLKGTLSIIDINDFKIKHTKQFDSEIKNIEYSIQSGLLAIGSGQMVTIFSIRDNWKKIIEYVEFNKNRSEDDNRKFLRDVKFNKKGTLLAVSFSQIDSVGGSEITILDCLNNFSVYKSFIPNAKKLIQEFYPNEEFEFPFDLVNDVNIDFLNFKNDTTLLFGILFANSNHKKLNYGEPEEFKNYLLVGEMDIINDDSKIIFSQRDHCFSNSLNNQIKLVGSNSLIFKCNSKIEVPDTGKEDDYSFLVQIRIDGKPEQIPNESLASMLKKAIKTEEQQTSASIKSAKSETESLVEFKQFPEYMPFRNFEELLREVINEHSLEFISKAEKSYRYVVTEHYFIIMNLLYKSPGDVDAYFFEIKKIKSLIFTEGFIQGLINPKISFYYYGIKYFNIPATAINDIPFIGGAFPSDGKNKNNLIEFRLNETDAEVLFKHLKRKTEKKAIINEVKINAPVKSDESKGENRSEIKNITLETKPKQTISDSDKLPIKIIKSKRKKNILVIASLIAILSLAGFFLFKYFSRDSYRKAVSYMTVGNFQQARYYADNCYTAINNQELEFTFEEKRNLDLLSDIANSLQKFNDFKQKFPYPARPILSQSLEIFNKEKNQMLITRNLFAEIPIKNILERTSIDFDTKKLMTPFIKYSDSLLIGYSAYITNDSFLLAIKTNKVSPNEKDYSWYSQNVGAIIDNVLDKKQNESKINFLQAKLKIFLQAINDNIKKREEEQKKIEQDSLQEGDSEDNNEGDI